MKKIISAVLACVLLAAMFVMPTSAAQSNVDVNALKFTKQPTFDGVISEEEWGAPTVIVKGSEAATSADEEVNEFNTYVEAEDEETMNQIGFDMWLRWDEQYFYVGVIAHDPDGHSLPNGGADIWNGDVIQFRVDPQGPNSVMKKSDPAYDYKTTEYNYNVHNFSSDSAKAWANEAKLINAGVGLVGGKTPAAYDMEAEQDMETSLYSVATVITGDMVETFGNDTTYEVAVPWDVIGADFKAEENSLLGMTLCLFNSMGGSYNGFLTWGSGISGPQAKNARKTCGGSNAVTLAAETVTPADDYAVATTEVVTTAPETEEVTTKAPETTKAEDSAEETKKDAKPNYNEVDGGGLPTAAIIAIVVAAVVVVAVVVIVIVKKKKK